MAGPAPIHFGMNDSRRVTFVSAGGAARAGISFGSALAIAISWSQNHSILWAIFQGFLGWLYVIYFAVTR
jgi:hypothetical protein